MVKFSYPPDGSRCNCIATVAELESGDDLESRLEIGDDTIIGRSFGFDVEIQVEILEDASDQRSVDTDSVKCLTADVG